MFRLARFPAVLACLVAASVAGTASAQDPAAVGGSNPDPAFVGGRQSGVSGSLSPSQDTLSFDEYSRAGQNDPQRAVRDTETLLRLVRGQLDGSQRSDARDGDRSDAIRYRSDAEVLIRRNWNRLGPLTRDLYTSQYGRTDPNDPSQRYRSPYGDNGQIENELLGGVRDASESMQNLEDLLLPMLQDLKRGLDAELRQRANSR